MRHTISRRNFVSTGAASLTAASSPLSLFSAEKEGAPAVLDHILLGCSDLFRGVYFVEKNTGVHAAFGGIHPGRGTRNAILSLGEQTGLRINPGPYLEIIAPDPRQPGAPDHYGLLKQTEPRLVGWAAHPGDLNEFASRLRDANIPFDGPNPGSRKRPDGGLLQWKTLNLKDDQSGILPFFIEWSGDTVHPSVDAPRGCHLARFSLSVPKDAEISHLCAILNLDVTVTHSEKPQLRVRIAGPKGKTLELSS